jgi:outer membrane protein OmpA-like peptidoglycan-associated protein
MSMRAPWLAASAPTRTPTRLPTLALLLVMLLVLAGCAGILPPQPAPGTAPRPATGAGTVPGTVPAPGSAAGSATAPAPAPSLQQKAALAEGFAVEQRWLDSWFRGTPVVISRPSDLLLSVEVPREFCFDAGRSIVKPALAAVLDKVADSLRRRPATHLVLLAAPADASGGETLAMQRADRIHRYLRDRGVRTSGMSRPTATSVAAVQLRIGATPP